jgi:hypothetical protein
MTVPPIRLRGPLESGGKSTATSRSSAGAAFELAEGLGVWAHEPEQAETAIDTMAMNIFFDRISGVR